MNITTEVEYIRGIVSTLAKNKDAAESLKGVISNGHLYLLILGGIFYQVDLSNKIDPNIICGFNYADLYNTPDCIIDNDTEEVKYYVLGVKNSINLVDCGAYNKEYENLNLREDITFETMVTSKSDAGSIKYFFLKSNGEKAFIILHKCIFNLNKPDTVKLQIFNTLNSTLMAKFTIYKKKIN